MIPLFEHHQLLAHKLAYVSLGELPTPVQKLDQLGRQIGLDSLFIKRDDLSGKVYGGNKVRKLEFILGKALRTKVNEVLTFGAAGSNHALATAIYAKQLGLNSISMLYSTSTQCPLYPPQSSHELPLWGRAPSISEHSVDHATRCSVSPLPTLPT